jgi:hypothetical protein
MKFLKRLLLLYLCLLLILISCSEGNNNRKKNNDVTEKQKFSSYADDREFLNKYNSVIELHNGDSKVLLVPAYQGRVMTSTCNGDSGYSFGWVNYDLIQSKQLKTHINAYGGEERLWLAPEGGQFSFFFKKGVAFDFENWFTPKEFDTESFETATQTNTAVLFKKDMVLTNRSGNTFSIHIDRKIALLDLGDIERNLGLELDSSIHAIAYESLNTLTNTGEDTWTKKTGAPAIWLLGMLKPSSQTTIVLPIKNSSGDTSQLLHDQYFGTIPSDRWKIEPGHAFLKADGKFRGKVGIPPEHSMNFIGSYDAASKVLTLLECDWPKGKNEFVNSAWEEQKDPFSGDAFNAYNDGPLKDGSQMGPFYELESLSPAAFLEPRKSIIHKQITYHIEGEESILTNIAQKVLGVNLQRIKDAFRTN